MQWTCKLQPTQIYILAEIALKRNLPMAYIQQISEAVAAAASCKINSESDCFEKADDLDLRRVMTGKKNAKYVRRHSV